MGQNSTFFRGASKTALGPLALGQFGGPRTASFPESLEKRWSFGPKWLQLIAQTRHLSSIHLTCSGWAFDWHPDFLSLLNPPCFRRESGLLDSLPCKFLKHRRQKADFSTKLAADGHGTGGEMGLRMPKPKEIMWENVWLMNDAGEVVGLA